MQPDSPPRLPANLQAARILIAEDNPINQQVLLAQMKLLGFDADVAADGRMALTRWREGGFAALVTDLQMPDMDGFELAASVRREEGDRRRIPIIALTANALKGESDRCEAAGMDGYLTKPVRLADLQALLERWLGAVPLPTPHGPAPAVVPGAGAGHGASAEPVDVDVLPRLVGADPAVLREFFQDFADSAAEAEAAIRKAAQAGLRKEVGSAAHRLKGSARSVGALRLGDQCAEAEAAASGSDALALASILQPLFAEVACVRAWIAAYLAASVRAGEASPSP